MMTYVHVIYNLLALAPMIFLSRCSNGLPLTLATCDMDSTNASIMTNYHVSGCLKPTPLSKRRASLSAKLALNSSPPPLLRSQLALNSSRPATGSTMSASGSVCACVSWSRRRFTRWCFPPVWHVIIGCTGDGASSSSSSHPVPTGRSDVSSMYALSHVRGVGDSVRATRGSSAIPSTGNTAMVCAPSLSKHRLQWWHNAYSDGTTEPLPHALDSIVY